MRNDNGCETFPIKELQFPVWVEIENTMTELADWREEPHAADSYRWEKQTLSQSAGGWPNHSHLPSTTDSVSLFPCLFFQTLWWSPVPTSRSVRSLTWVWGVWSWSAVSLMTVMDRTAHTAMERAIMLAHRWATVPHYSWESCCSKPPHMSCNLTLIPVTHLIQS